MLKKVPFFFICILCLFLTACQGDEEPAAEEVTEPKTATIHAMDTVMNLSVYTADDALMEQADELVTDLESHLSTTMEESEIYTLNQDKSVTLTDRTSELLNEALGFCKKTDGALDLSIYPVVRAWGFTTDSYQIPPQSQLDQLLSHVDYTKIDYNKKKNTVSIPDNMEIDLGSVAKGYTGDQLIELFRDGGVTSALLNLGGNVQALGSKPDGSPWRIGIQDPLGEDFLGVLSITDKAVITSGGYERFFKGDDGTVYWHIIDPKTGKPAKNGLISTTAIGPKGVYCDGLSTSLFIMGPEKAVAFWKEHKDFDMILITEEKDILITPDLADSFELVDGVPYTVKVIEND